MRPEVVVRSVRPFTLRVFATRFGPLPPTVAGGVIAGAVGDVGIEGVVGAVSAPAVVKVWSALKPVPSTELVETRRQW